MPLRRLTGMPALATHHGAPPRAACAALRAVVAVRSRMAKRKNIFMQCSYHWPGRGGSRARDATMQAERRDETGGCVRGAWRRRRGERWQE